MESEICRVCFNGFTLISKAIASLGYKAQDMGRLTRVPKEPKLRRELTFFLTRNADIC
jgi:hypothetical protein